MNDRQIAIFGQYKTGTTALFYQLLGALPPDTHTLFEPMRYEAGRGRASAVLAKVILALYDGPNKVCYEDFLGFPHKILLLRDPRDRIVSGTLFIVQQSPHIYEDERRLSRVSPCFETKRKSRPAYRSSKYWVRSCIWLEASPSRRPLRSSRLITSGFLTSNLAWADTSRSSTKISWTGDSLPFRVI